jgi:preprotein translocase subunit SecA
VQQETKTFATITIQNYFRMYAKLAGMTGTAETEAEEFSKIYKLEVVRIPTHQPMIRQDFGDQIFKNEESKFKALVKEVEEVHKQGRPVLIGTVAIENSEKLSRMLNQHGIKHDVLNAKQHEREANKIALAGELGAVTIATNMAGRGVDIILGGDPWGYEPYYDILHKILKKEEIDAARQLIGENIKERPFPANIESTIKNLQLVESNLRQKRRESVINSVYIENDEIEKIRNEQRNSYKELAKQFEHWDKEISEKLARELSTAIKNNNEEKGKKLKQEIEKFASLPNSNDSYEQIEIILEKHDADLKNWQSNHNKVVELGGLYVLGSERHEARRIDNQLRGRAGRQGDPGSSRFYVGLDDELMRRFGGERIQGIMNWAGMDENTPIENKLISSSIVNAQTKVEGYNFDIRKHLVDYDDVINKQREIIYGERHKILSGADLRSNILDMVKAVIEVETDKFLKVPGGEEPDFAALIGAIKNIFPVPPEINPEALSQMRTEEVVDKFVQTADELYAKKEDEVGPANMRTLERLVMLRVIDTLWVEHLTAVDYLRQGIGLEAAGQQDPLVAYKRRSSIMFEELRDAIRDDVAHLIYRVSIVKPGAPGQAAPAPSSPMTKIVGKPGEKKPSLQPGHEPGRNEACPCGSGKKYKRCHGANEPS